MKNKKVHRGVLVEVKEIEDGIRRGLEARRRGDRIHWDDVKDGVGAGTIPQCK